MSLSRLFTGTDADPVGPGEDEIPTGAVADDAEHGPSVPLDSVVAADTPPRSTSSRSERRPVRPPVASRSRGSTARRGEVRKIPHGGTRKAGESG